MTDNDEVKSLLLGYRTRIAERLGVAIERSWNMFLPFFTDHVLNTVRTKIPTTTAAHPDDDSLLYPEGTKYLYRYGNECFVVVEQKPQVRTMHFAVDGDKRLEGIKKATYRLAFPYVVFVVGLVHSEEGSSNMETAWVLNSACCGYSNKSVRSLNDLIYQPNLPNINAFQVCVGSGYSNRPSSIAEIVDRLVAHFWQGQFSRDWSDVFEDYRRNEPNFATLEVWEQASIKNPLFPTKIAWKDGRPIGILLSKVCAKIKGDPFSIVECFSRQVVAEAAKMARLDVAAAFEGVEVESLDDKFCDDLNKHLADKGENNEPDPLLPL